MERALEQLVWDRAHSWCEYCHIPQDYDGFVHEIDHVIAKKHGGSEVAGNLALACFPCNNHKGPNIAGLDPLTKKLTPLFNPRRHKWASHFRWKGPYLVGKTAMGRVAVAVLEINSSERVLLRQALIDEGIFPTPAS
ncbi:MAG TPA: HNH endonuclease signature motif containing protein [Gemmataceae bacterium]|nr:HNH endonuclease signature motif containing protein [Gemmataceae bacterium]